MADVSNSFLDRARARLVGASLAKSNAARDFSVAHSSVGGLIGEKHQAVGEEHTTGKVKVYHVVGA